MAFETYSQTLSETEIRLNAGILIIELEGISKKTQIYSETYLETIIKANFFHQRT